MGVGAVVTSLLFAIGIITVKVFMKHKQRKRGSLFVTSAESFISPSHPPLAAEAEFPVTLQKVSMERNVSYELHKPLPRRKGRTGPPEPCSGTANPIYEDLK